MSVPELKVFCVHGVGNHHEDLSWQAEWKGAIRSAVGVPEDELAIEFNCPTYDALFSEFDLTVLGTVKAAGKLAGSGIAGLFRRRRGFFDRVREGIRWTAGMVVEWVENEQLREATRQWLIGQMRGFDPNVVCAHSLGSLICYDAFTHDPGGSEIKGRTFISFGSQIGNPFVVGNFAAGRLLPLPADRWYHLYNRHDDVFTAPIRLSSPRFEQVETPFDLPGPGDHDATCYLAHAATRQRIWAPLVADLRGPRFSRRLRRIGRATERAKLKPIRRALLAGINEYPNPENRLEGCANDVFLFSSALQECGFAPADIRVVLDDRATAQGIRERLDWLVDGASAGDQLVFYYSGHGAQLPTYDAGDIVDRMDECLVPYDFDWSTERAITDNQIYELYSQLPYKTGFLIFLDCCHSGGMARGGSPRVRGLDPPDDIRHRMLRWDAEHSMWVPRQLRQLNRNLANDPKVIPAYSGASGSVCRLGRAMSLRTLAYADYDRVCKEQGHRGPFLPIIMQACQEDQYAYEYRHGVTSYGAFTYCLVKNLRQERKITFKNLARKTAKELHDLDYDQTPALVGPAPLLQSPVPWGRVLKSGRRRRKK